MRVIHTLFVLSIISNPLGLTAQGVELFCDQLIATPAYHADATFEVLLPSHEDPVTYQLNLQSTAVNDSLAACDYLIRWTTESPGGALSGFSAYFDGNHYRYRNNRLQEYHIDANAVVFAPKGCPDPTYAAGVQNQAQFVDLLPQYLGHKLRRILVDTCYHYAFHPDTLVHGRHTIVIDGIKRTRGYDSQYFTYVFDKDTCLPLYTDIVTGPGSISEQIITVHYKLDSSLGRLEYSEEALIDQWPDVFERYRESTFGIESLVGNPLPDFSCQILGSTSRMSHKRGDKMNNPAIIVAVNPEVASTGQTIQAVREGRDMLPSYIDVIYAFNTNRTDEIQDIVGNMAAGETVLSSASSLIRNCGISLFPAIIFVNSEGNVQDVSLGFNNELSSIVIEKAMMLK